MRRTFLEYEEGLRPWWLSSPWLRALACESSEEPAAAHTGSKRLHPRLPLQILLRLPRSTKRPAPQAQQQPAPAAPARSADQPEGAGQPGSRRIVAVYAISHRAARSGPNRGHGGFQV